LRRALIDTEVLVGGLLVGSGAAARLVDAWLARRFVLCCAEAQIGEVAAVLKREELKAFVAPMRAEQWVADVRRLSTPLTRIRLTERGGDAPSNALLGLAQAGGVDVLVVGEGSPLRALGTHGAVKIRTAREFSAVLALE
jgi:uncharacterized protein